jgi:hypothetical protein
MAKQPFVSILLLTTFQEAPLYAFGCKGQRTFVIPGGKGKRRSQAPLQSSASYILKAEEVRTRWGKTEGGGGKAKGVGMDRGGGGGGMTVS